MDLRLRCAKEEDCDLLYAWANDATVRQNAFKTQRIRYEDHKQWFREKLGSGKSVIFICHLDKEPIGQIRVDFQDDGAGLISYSIAEEFRGKGYGTELLKRITGEISKHRPETKVLTGRVKHGNTASCRAFEKAGYNRVDRDEYIEYSINIRKAGIGDG